VHVYILEGKTTVNRMMAQQLSHEARGEHPLKRWRPGYSVSLWLIPLQDSR